LKLRQEIGEQSGQCWGFLIPFLWLVD